MLRPRSGFRKAADQGYARAQENIASRYYNGQGVPQSYPEAAKWYRMAADQGGADAQYYLGLMYYHGLEVPQDYVQAHMWLNLAASVHSEFIERREEVAIKMTPAQIAEAQKLAVEWKCKR